MTKKTNAATQRLGYNLFWLNKKSGNFSFHSFNSLFDLLQKELRKNSFVCFNLKKINQKIYLSLYNLSLISAGWSNHSLLNLKQIGQLNTKKLCNLQFHYTNSYFIPVSRWGALNLIQIFSNIEILTSIITFYKFLLRVHLTSISINHSKFISHATIINTKFNRLLISERRLKEQTSKVLNIKLFEVHYELILNKYYSRFHTISIFNILDGLIPEYFISQYDPKVLNLTSNIKNKRLFFILYILFVTKNIELLSRFIGAFLVMTHRHKKNMINITKSIYILYNKQVIRPRGFKLYVSGKFNGKMKRSKYGYNLGEMWLNTFKNQISYFYLPVYTKFGVFSVKIWVAY